MTVVEAATPAGARRLYRDGLAAPSTGHAPGFTRPIPATLVATAVQVTGRMPQVHGAPVHVGEPDALGVRELGEPDFGDAVEFEPGDVPVFWACGVTPQAALMASRPPFAITHAPGHIFVTDVSDAVYRQP